MMPPPESVPVHETRPDEAKSQAREVAYSLLIELLAYVYLATIVFRGMIAKHVQPPIRISGTMVGFLRLFDVRSG